MLYTYIIINLRRDRLVKYNRLYYMEHNDGYIIIDSIAITLTRVMLKVGAKMKTTITYVMYIIINVIILDRNVPVTISTCTFINIYNYLLLNTATITFHICTIVHNKSSVYLLLKVRFILYYRWLR